MEAESPAGSPFVCLGKKPNVQSIIPVASSRSNNNYQNQNQTKPGTSLAVQWIRLCATIAGGTGLIPGWGTKILHAARYNQKKKKNLGASLVAQWLRICLPMQGTWVRAMVWEDPTCLGATKPASHNY